MLPEYLSNYILQLFCSLTKKFDSFQQKYTNNSDSNDYSCSAMTQWVNDTKAQK